MAGVLLDAIELTDGAGALAGELGVGQDLVLALVAAVAAAVPHGNALVIGGCAVQALPGLGPDVGADATAILAVHTGGVALHAGCRVFQTATQEVQRGRCDQGGQERPSGHAGHGLVKSSTQGTAHALSEPMLAGEMAKVVLSDSIHFFQAGGWLTSLGHTGGVKQKVSSLNAAHVGLLNIGFGPREVPDGQHANAWLAREGGGGGIGVSMFPA